MIQSLALCGSGTAGWRRGRVSRGHRFGAALHWPGRCSCPIERPCGLRLRTAMWQCADPGPKKRSEQRAFNALEPRCQRLIAAGASSRLLRRGQGCIRKVRLPSRRFIMVYPSGSRAEVLKPFQRYATCAPSAGSSSVLLRKPVCGIFVFFIRVDIGRVPSKGGIAM